MSHPARIAAVLSLVRGPRVLDLGCVNNAGVPTTERARSHWLHGALVDAGFSVVGGDIQPVGLEEMRRLGYDAVLLDAERIPADGERFDTIVAGELIEHLSNQGLFFDGARARLKPGGRLIVSTPNPWSPPYFLQYLAKTRKPAFNVEHALWLDPQTLEQSLARHGFRVVERVFVNDLWHADALSAYGLFCRAWGVACRALPARLQGTHVTAAEPT